MRLRRKRGGGEGEEKEEWRRIRRRLRRRDGGREQSLKSRMTWRGGACDFIFLASAYDVGGPVLSLAV